MLETMFSRRSVRKWAPGAVTEEQVQQILHAAMAAPSAGNEQAWQFVVLDDPEVLGEYQNINRNMPKGAPVAILVCSDRSAEKYPGYSVQDCSAATQNLLLAVHALGLGGVWTTVFPDKVAALRNLLGLPEHVVPFACVPFGPVEGAGEPHDRYDPDRVHTNRW